jgi:hypothetical protein
VDRTYTCWLAQAWRHSQGGPCVENRAVRSQSSPSLGMAVLDRAMKTDRRGYKWCKYGQTPPALQTTAQSNRTCARPNRYRPLRDTARSHSPGHALQASLAVDMGMGAWKLADTGTAYKNSLVVHVNFTPSDEDTNVTLQWTVAEAHCVRERHRFDGKCPPRARVFSSCCRDRTLFPPLTAVLEFLSL